MHSNKTEEGRCQRETKANTLISKSVKAEHIEEGYKKRGVSEKEAESRAWATVNKESGGGKESGSGRGKKESHESSRKGERRAAKSVEIKVEEKRSRVDRSDSNS